LRWWWTVLVGAVAIAAIGGPPTGWARSTSSTMPATASATSAPPAPFTSWDDFLDQQYLDLLGRQPTLSSRAAAHDALQAGTMSTGQFITSVRSSGDHKGNVDPVARLYRASFLRSPDRGGLVHWIAARRGGWTLGRIADAFVRSGEFADRYGSLSNRQFVELVYANVLQRTPDRGGIEFWTAQLDQRRRSRGAVMVEFSDSNEFRGKQASEVTASVLPILLLGRAPTGQEFGAAVARLDGGGSIADEAARILATAEYQHRASRTRTVVFGDSIPDSLINNGSAGTDLSRYELVNGTVPACDGVDRPPRARIRDGTIHFMTAECARGWKRQYPPDLVFEADRVILATGVNAMLDHELHGIWRHPCHTAARDWYRSDLANRLRYLHTRADRVVLVLPPWPGENSGWIMPADMVARADCVRGVMAEAARQTGTPMVDLGARVCPNPRACARPYRTRDGIHVDVAKSAEILTWLLAASSSSSDPVAGPAGSGTPSLPDDTAPSPPRPLDPGAGTPPPEYRFSARTAA
jgi:hypothetical protein